MTRCQVDKEQITQWSPALLTSSTAPSVCSGLESPGSITIRAVGRALGHLKHSL